MSRVIVRRLKRSALLVISLDVDCISLRLGCVINDFDKQSPKSISLCCLGAKVR